MAQSEMMEGLSELVGLEGEEFVMEVERGAVRRYADAVGDPNPVHRDDGAAIEAGFSGIVAPAGFFGWPTRGGDIRGQLEIRRRVERFFADRGYRRLVEGELGFELFAPVCAGDTLIARPRVGDIYDRDGSQGKMFFVVVNVAFYNENRDLVAEMRQTLIVR